MLNTDNKLYSYSDYASNYNGANAEDPLMGALHDNLMGTSIYGTSKNPYNLESPKIEDTNPLGYINTLSSNPKVGALNTSLISNYNIGNWSSTVKKYTGKPSQVDPIHPKKGGIKFGNFIGGLADTASSLIGGEAKSDSVKAADKVFNAGSDVVMAINPLAGTIMKLGGLTVNALRKAGLSTDMMTTTDKILGSKFGALTGAGLLNNSFSSKTASFGLDEDVQSKLGQSYTDTYSNDLNKAAATAGKKVGLLSSMFGDKKKLNNKIYLANLEQQKLTKSLEDTENRRMGGTNPLLNLGTKLELSGGYDLGNTYYGKNGLKFQEGGTVDGITSEASYAPSNEVVNYILKQVMIQNPNWVQRLYDNDPLVITKDGKNMKKSQLKGEDYGTHELGFSDNENNWIIYPNIRQAGDKLYRFHNWSNALNTAIKNNDVVSIPKNKVSFKDINWFTTNNYKKYFPATKGLTMHKNGGNVQWAKEILSRSNKKFYDFLKEECTESSKPGDVLADETAYMKAGGTFNVIPEGALHKNKHHLEDVDDKFKDVTNKGIPVVTEGEGGNLQQQAEVEKEEIIFNLDVTKKLEALKEKGTDEAAIEAGKLLVHEILNNTVDNTGILKEIQ
jgi:hypothetical protein